MEVGQDFKVISDTVLDGVRHISAQPSALVCSSRIDFDVIDGKIHNLVYEKGCHGNLIAVGRLVEGLPLEKVSQTLDGVNCHGRGTSCTDQLSRILKSL